MDKLINEFLEIVNNKKIESTSLYNSLKTDERVDEANLQRIKVNIYNTFETVILSLKKEVLKKHYSSEKENYDALCKAYINSLENIPANWRTKLEKAKENNDVENIIISQTQLDVANELKKIFTELM